MLHIKICLWVKKIKSADKFSNYVTMATTNCCCYIHYLPDKAGYVTDIPFPWKRC